MAIHLVVLKPFLHYVKGDIITDPTQVAAIRSSDHRKFVLKVASKSGA